ncbi:hypothetical protein MZM54_04150 [[Brevibacterium] frigoritolerans]|nr:hypothetical protein [Peribacillus frigoritolerans]
MYIDRGDMNRKGGSLSSLSKEQIGELGFAKSSVNEKSTTSPTTIAIKARKEEIVSFSTELKKFKLSYSVLISEKPRSRTDREKVLEIAKFVCFNPTVKDTFLNQKKLPVKTIKEQFQVPKSFVSKNKHYLTAIALLLIGPYVEIQNYFLEQGVTG